MQQVTRKGAVHKLRYAIEVDGQQKSNYCKLYQNGHTWTDRHEV